ncbi:MAG: OmpA family protein, partial [Pseudomonadota bacterium]
TVSSADDPRYMWASEAKVQCAIALGYLKSNTRDETSIGKCGYAFDRMSVVPSPVVRAPVVAPPPPPPPAVCQTREPTLVFFEWDSSTVSPEASDTIRATADTARECGWSSFSVVGHTDRSGSNSYNDALSFRRAEAIANEMVGLGIGRGQMNIGAEGENNPRVPTEDGVRSPQNRRVEITVSQ